MCEDKNDVKRPLSVNKSDNPTKKQRLIDFAANEVDPEKNKQYLDEFKNILDQDTDNENR